MKPDTLLSTDDIVYILKHKLFIKDEHIQFLKLIGGTFKIRQFYFEVVMFDLLYATRTSDFLPEELYLRLGKENPNSFASPFHVTHGVKYRGSLTSSIVYGLTEAICILQNNEIKPNTAYSILKTLAHFSCLSKPYQCYESSA